MLSPYKLSAGETVKIKVNPAVAELLADYEREDKNEARNTRRHNEVSLDALCEETEWEPADTTVDIEAEYIAKEEAGAVVAAVAGLSEKQGRLVRLRYYEGKTTYEIAGILGVSQPAVIQQLATLKNALKKYFDNFSG